MIVTVTPAPAIDWTAHVERFDWDAVNRIESSSREPSGKGLNVSWALHRAGVTTSAVFPGGGGTAEFMTSALADAGLAHVLVPTGRDIRTNLTLVTGGHATKLNEPGAPLTQEQSTSLVDAALSTAQGARAVLLCGSHPEGFAGEHVARLVRGAHELNLECVLDTSGTALEHAIGLAPDLIKPNVHELAELCGREIGSLSDVVAAARSVCDEGVGAVLASLGADGAALVSADRVVVAAVHDIPFVNSVGAGDALLAGFMSRTGDPAARLKQAVLWASSAVSCPTTLFPVREDLQDLIDVSDWDGVDVHLTERSLVPTR